ncbi:MAG: reverse transcriptase-like protein [Actinobacteria bacterium]|nr:MAG: reverse transcriptase-like protein [Actinomycetota bacterium]
MEKHMTLFVDGAARGNPGPAGVAAVLVDDDGREAFIAKEYIGEATNNAAEYRALMLGLCLATGVARELSVRSDSELVVRQVKGEYKVKNVQLKEYVARVMALLGQFGKVQISSIPREENARADELANSAIDEFQAGERDEAPGAPGRAQERLFDV